MSPRRLEGPPVTAEEYGFLIKGAVRASEVAIADLLHSGALRVNRDGELSATGAATRTSHLQAEVLAVVGDAAVTLAEIVNKVAIGPSLQSLEKRLRSRHLSGRRFFPLRQRTHIAATNKRLTAAHLLLSSMLSSAAGLVAAEGCAAYPDPEIAEALEWGRAGYPSTNAACSGGGCGGGL